jgi:hypothetical protein
MASKKNVVVEVSGVQPPEGLRDKGSELWCRLTAEYDFGAAPEKLLLLEEAARTADMVARLQTIVDEAQELRVRGSQGQPVAMPEVQELRQYRAQLTALVKALALPEEESEGAMTRSQLARHAARARWANRTGG